MVRKPGTTRAEFSESWLRHGKLVLDWFTQLGVAYYFQIHLPEDLPDSAGIPGDGVAVVAYRESSSIPGGGGGKDSFYEDYVLPDERRFLHDESGSKPILRDPPAFVIPKKETLEWRDLALKAGAKEYRLIEDGKVVINFSEVFPV